MSFLNCIKAKIEQGLLTQKQYDEVAQEYETLLGKYAKTMGDENAAALAAEQVVSIKANTIMKKHRNQKMAALAQMRLRKDVLKKFNEYDAFYTGLNKFQRSVYGKPSVSRVVGDLIEAVDDRKDEIFRRSMAGLFDFIKANRPKLGGVIDNAENMPFVVREMMGEATGNAEAALFGKQLRKTMDDLSDMYRAEGGIMGKLDNYFPQTHNGEQIKRVPFDQWRDYLLPRLDVDRMVDIETGMPIDTNKLVRMMKADYDSITTNGLNEVMTKAMAGGKRMGGGGDVAMRRESSRFYHFKNADSWFEYNSRFGYGDGVLFDVIIGQMQTLSRDIALMQKMGAQPHGAFSNLEMLMTGSGESSSRVTFARGMYNTVSGRNGFGGTQSAFSKALSGYRDLHRAAVLGSAAISAISDSTFVALASRYAGLEATKTLTRYMGQLNPLNATDRQVARRALATAQMASGVANRAGRFSEDLAEGGVASLSGGFLDKFAGFSRKASGFVHSVGGLQAMTEAAQIAPTLELSGKFAQLKIDNVPWEKLDKPFMEAMERADITKKDYNAILGAELWIDVHTQASFLRPEEVAMVDKKASYKLGDFMAKISKLAANEPSIRTKTIMTGAAIGDAQVGSLNRDLASTLLMYKGFSITMFINHLLPAMQQAAVGRGGNLAIVAAGGTMLGAVAMQMKQVINGKDSRDMDDWKFWRAAALQGGGLGLLGDFMFADYSRFGRTPFQELAGPVVGTIGDVSRIFMGNFERALDEGTDSNMLADTYKLLYRHAPAQNLWYTRLLAERYLLDTVSQMLDPKFKSNVKRSESMLYNETGQKYWWRRGTALPQRAPDIGVNQ